MNSETFAKYLKTPAYLYRVSYQELKSLVVQYPYCQNLRFLLLKKSQADGHEEYERNLQMAATYSAQRSLLYEQLYNDEVAEIDRTSNADEEAILDLKDLNVKEEVREKEILYAQNEEETPREKSDLSLMTEAPRKDLPSLDLSKIAEEETEIGDPATDEIPADSESGIDDIFAEIEAENPGAEEETLDLTAHQISETVDLPEPEAEENPEPAPPLDEVKTEADDLPPEALPESATDSDIEELFREEPAPESPLPAESQLLSKKENTEEVPTVQQTIAENEAKTDAETPEDATPSVHDLSEVTKENDEEDEYETETVSPHSSFGAWLKQFNSPQISVEIEDLESNNRNEKVNYKYELIDGEWKQIKIKKKKKKKKKSEAELIAAESVKLSEEIATETLAQLLEKQGYYAKAIKMYERLSLEIPEKSNFFAAKIKTLQFKL